MINMCASQCGGVAERLNAPVLKTGIRESVSRVRIPPPPPVRTKKTQPLKAVSFLFLRGQKKVQIITLYHLKPRLIGNKITP